MKTGEEENINENATQIETTKAKVTDENEVLEMEVGQDREFISGESSDDDESNVVVINPRGVRQRK